VTLSVSTPEELRLVMKAEFTVGPQQWDAIRAPLEPGVVIAGAGSGKTTLMAARVVYLVATGQVTPDQVLGLTFTAKAAAELRLKIEKALQTAGFLTPPGLRVDAEADEILTPTVATYNAYAAGLVVEHATRIGREPDSRLLTEGARHQLAAQVVARHRGKVSALDARASTVISQVLRLDGQMNEHLCSAEQIREFHAGWRAGWSEQSPRLKGERDLLDKAIKAIDQREELLALVEEYRQAKVRHGLIDFADQISLAARIATQCPEVGKLERDRFRLVLLDEYQDTSVAQALLLSDLYSGPTVESGRGHPVTAVGDPHQAIYGWRGASVSNILRFGESFPRAEGTQPTLYPLTVNRRSDRRILEVANAIAEDLHAISNAVAPLDAAPESGLGEVRAAAFLTDVDEFEQLPTEVAAARAGVAGGQYREIAVLVRNNGHAAAVYDVLNRADIPVEIVGLKGLLEVPEVAGVLAVLHVLEEPTANAAMLQILSGPRWAIGPRDLALLARRADGLIGGRRHQDADSVSIDQQLDAITEGTDPTEVAALLDALDDPGDLPYADEARERFAALSAELKVLRGHVGDPLSDLVHRVIDLTGIEIELGSSLAPFSANRRDNLDAFGAVVADFSPIDGEASLSALLAYLGAQQGTNEGLDQATPSASDSVKVLTVHKAKGLEWAAVFVAGVTETQFPSDRAPAFWPTTAEVLPYPLRGDARDLPHLRGHDVTALGALKEESARHQAIEERRLAYVAFTRAKHLMVASGSSWRKANKTRYAPSEYLCAARDLIVAWGGAPDRWDLPEEGSVNPRLDAAETITWPPGEIEPEVALRRAAAERVRRHLAAPDADDAGLPALDDEDAALVAVWDDEIERLLAHHLRSDPDEVDVPIPATLSATQAMRLREDPAALVLDLVRPMPERPSPAARFGTRFHAWVESYLAPAHQDPLVDPDDLPGRGDLDIADEADLRALADAFMTSPFAGRSDAMVEMPFRLVIDGQAVLGRIDAVFPEPDGGFLIVDWKTNVAHTADPLQLAIYREAWAELRGIGIEKIRAGFFYVRTGELVEPELPSREELVSLLEVAPPSPPIGTP
jgi:DNA helicase-2/ATP-dependent DNA helicase PcrA